MTHTPEQVLEIVKRFCATEDSRYAISTPFRDGDYVCATNGRLAVRVLASKCAEIPTRKKHALGTPPISELRWGTEKYLPNPEPISDGLKEPQWIECNVCRGESFHYCTDCGESHQCGRCGGTGGSHDSYAVKFSTGALFDCRYVSLLKELGASLYLVDPETQKDETLKPAYFTIGDIEGLMMGVIPDMCGDREIIANA